METTGEHQVVEEEGFTKCTIQGNAKSLASYLPHYQTIPRDMKALPTFMRSISRKTPRNAPAGIDNCGPQDLARWRDDQHRFPPYQYKHDNTIYDKRKRRRSVPDTRLREVLMLFREDHTYAGITKRERCKGPEQHRDLRDSWLGNSMHCGVVAVLLRPFFHSTYPNCSLPSVQELIDMNPHKNVRNMSEEMRLTRAYCTYQSHRGGEIRNEQGPEPSLQRSGFQAIQGDQWKWKAAISCQWHLTTEHINALECRALLLALRWRARNVKHFSKRFLHLCDNQAVLGAFCKHRSNAHSLNYLLQRAAALELATEMKPIMAFVRSHANAADAPSRRMGPTTLLLNRAGQRPRSSKGAVTQ